MSDMNLSTLNPFLTISRRWKNRSSKGCPLDDSMIMVKVSVAFSGMEKGIYYSDQRLEVKGFMDTNMLLKYYKLNYIFTYI